MVDPAAKNMGIQRFLIPWLTNAKGSTQPASLSGTRLKTSENGFRSGQQKMGHLGAALQTAGRFGGL